MDRLALLRRYGDDIARLATPSNLERRVPSCPDWTLGDLVYHLGEVQSFWAGNLLARDATGRVERDRDVAQPDDEGLGAWFASCASELRAALEEVGDRAPCWTWWGEPATSGAVARHQVHEAAIHHYDAHLALGEHVVLDPEVAQDGIDEFLEVHRDELVMPEGATVILRSLDAERR